MVCVGLITCSMAPREPTVLFPVLFTAATGRSRPLAAPLPVKPPRGVFPPAVPSVR